MSVGIAPQVGPSVKNWVLDEARGPSRGFALSGTHRARDTNHGRPFPPQVRISLAWGLRTPFSRRSPQTMFQQIPIAMNPLRPFCLALVLSTCLAQAHAAVVANPPIRMAPEGTEYMCGGSGQAEAAFMDMVTPRWAASFQFAINEAAGSDRSRVAGVKLVVRDAYNGYQVLGVMADAPHLLARLSPGSYTVEATLDGLTLIQPLNVVQGKAATALFVWPSNLSAPSQTQAALK